MDDILVILFMVVICVIFLGLLMNGQTRKIIADLLFGRM